MKDEVKKESQSSWPGLSRPSTPLGAATQQGVDARNKCGHDGRGAVPARVGIDSEIVANPYVLQELAKPRGEREHEIRRARRPRVPPHGYPLSGRDAAGRPVLFHSDEKERFHADRP
jgi:hypothetical protein